MSLVVLLCLPLFAAGVLAVVRERRLAAEINVAASVVTFLAGMWLAWDVHVKGPVLVADELLFADAFSVYLELITTFVGMTTSVFSRRYMTVEQQHGALGPQRMRYYHTLFQLFIATMLVALLTNSVGILWIAMEMATLSTVLLVSLYRTPSSIEAAWKYFILCGVGIAQALFGTILLYLAAEKVLGEGGEALLWTNLNSVGRMMEPNILSMAFVFLMVGYGTKMGLVPVHHWLPDANSEGPPPIALLSGLLLNVALYALVRCKVLVDASLGTHHAGNIMMGFGLLSVIVAAFSILRQKDLKRMFAYSSIEHMGIATFAFGLGGATATFGALLHMLVHSLTKSTLFFTGGHAIQMHRSQEMSRIRGLIRGNPVVGWGLMFGVMAIVGMPPFGVFISEFLILTATVKSAPYLVPVLVVGLAVAASALFRRVQSMVMAEVPSYQHPVQVAYVPIVLHAALVLMIGLYIPPFFDQWLKNVAEYLK
ncbi:hydrogenase 4 subunit F [Candidatus Magnetobacterium casense]|uniref:Hydrogenase 4 subunit F n=1 Tax=Candidatus Magnetobacterium casense TaxID=1455061 RepID=A0ABS6S0M8_9BACT|nr:hydrogenase 4 subunit F [Candidatus Magnetobacterium casensis]MBV6342405.1 hydrogenase 4 subunit F [Candidatus Magnetobacterium casensis]